MARRHGPAAVNTMATKTSCPISVRQEKLTHPIIKQPGLT